MVIICKFPGGIRNAQMVIFKNKDAIFQKDGNFAFYRLTILLQTVWIPVLNIE